MTNIKILDCTLRDGGYYNNWDFDAARSKELIVALNEAGVDIIEVGYKSIDDSDFGGLFKFCNESLLSYLKDYREAEYAFMIDIKEFLNADGSLNYEALNQCILPEEQSVFSWVRLASHYTTLESIPIFISYFKSKQYKICFNLMGGSLLSEEQISKAIELVNPNPPEVFYIADSFGSFYAEEVSSLVKLIKSKFKGKVGIHTHDNQGMAFSNTLAAIEAGVDFVDGTVTGMGRGAGNLAIEQFLQKYADLTTNDKYRPNALLGIINEYIQPLKDQYKWGFNYVYMLSGLKNIHPTYCQTLSEGNRYTISQISTILEKIPEDKRSKYNAGALQTAIKEVLESHSSSGDSVKLKTGFSQESQNVLVVAKGSSVKNHWEALEMFTKDKKALVIECNDTGYFDSRDQRIIALLNEVKLLHFLEKNRNSHQVILTGQSAVDKSFYHENLYFQNFTLGTFGVNGENISIPDYDAGLFAIAVAVRFGARNIYLAGFDGFEEDGKNQAIETFLAEANEYLKSKNISLISLTPTRYKNIKQSTVYLYLNSL